MINHPTGNLIAVPQSLVSALFCTVRHILRMALANHILHSYFSLQHLMIAGQSLFAYSQLLSLAFRTPDARLEESGGSDPIEFP